MMPDLACTLNWAPTEHLGKKMTRTKLGRGTIHCALCVAHVGTMNCAPTEPDSLCKPRQALYITGSSLHTHYDNILLIIIC